MLGSIAGAVFANKLSSGLLEIAPNLPEEVVAGVRQSVTVIFTLPPDQQALVIKAYVKALNYVYLVGVPVVSSKVFHAAGYSSERVRLAPTRLQCIIASLSAL